MNATKRFRARLHEVTQQWLRELVAEVVAAHTPALPASRVSPCKVKRRAPTSSPQKRTSGSRSAKDARQQPVTNESAKPEPAAPLLPLSPPGPSVEKPEVIPSPAAPTVTVSSPAKRWGLPRASAPRQPKPAGAPALMGAPRAPLVAAGRGRTAEQLREVAQRAGAASKASRALTKALGPQPKLSTSDDELEQWCREQLGAGISGSVPLSALEDPEPTAPVVRHDEDEEDEG